MRLHIALCFALLVAGAAQATTVRPVELSELAEASEHILFGRVEMGQIIPGNCGNRYVLKVEETYKGGVREASAVLFSNSAPMTIGSHYVLFLSKEDASFKPLYSTNTFGPRPDPDRARLCANSRPRYTVNIWGVGAFKVSGTYESSDRVAIFDDFMIRMPKGVKQTKLKFSRRYDTETAEGALKFETLREILTAKATATGSPLPN